MTQATVVKPGTVKVSPGEIDVADVLEHAAASIDEIGWRQGERATSKDGAGGWDAVAETDGLSLHDAVQFSCDRLGVTESLRVKAADAVIAALPPGSPVTAGVAEDITFNDAAKDKSEVIKVIDDARKRYLDDQKVVAAGV